MPEGVERLRDDAGACERGHEISVAGPSRDEVPMEVSGQSCTGSAAQVQSDVESIGFDELAIDARESG